MADDKQKTGADANKAQGAQPTSESNSTEALASQADFGDLQEAEVRTLRQDAGLNQLAGHEANVLAWEKSPAGKAFLDSEKDRQKEIKEEGKRLSALTNDDNLDEGAVKYVEASEGKVKSESRKAQKEAEKSAKENDQNK